MVVQVLGHVGAQGHPTGLAIETDQKNCKFARRPVGHVRMLAYQNICDTVLIFACLIFTNSAQILLGNWMVGLEVTADQYYDK